MTISKSNFGLMTPKFLSLSSNFLNFNNNVKFCQKNKKKKFGLIFYIKLLYTHPSDIYLIPILRYFFFLCQGYGGK